MLDNSSEATELQQHMGKLLSKVVGIASMNSASDSFISQIQELENTNLDEDSDVMFYKGHMTLTDMYTKQVLE